MRVAGRTVVLVTHDMSAVQRHCSRAMLLHDGELRHIGDPEEAARRYLRLNFAQTDAPSQARDQEAMPEMHARLVDAWFEDEAGKRITNLEQGQPIRIRVVVEAREQLPHPVFGFHCTNADGVHVFGLNATLDPNDGEPDPVETGQRVRVTGAIENRLTPGRYFISCLIARHPGDIDLQRLRPLEFVVYGTPTSGRRLHESRRRRRSGRQGSIVSGEVFGAELHEVRGPSALGGGGRRFFDLLFLISVTEFKKTYFGTVLGYVWSLIRPLTLFGVLLFVFTQIFRIGSEVTNYPVLLLFNIVVFTFFQEATNRAVTSVVAQEGIVRKTQFPRLVIPMAPVLTSLFNLGVNLVAVFIFLLAFRGYPDMDVALPPRDRRDPLRAHRGDLDADLVAVRPLSGRGDHLVRRGNGALLRHPPSCTRSRSCPRGSATS